MNKKSHPGTLSFVLPYPDLKGFFHSKITISIDGLIFLLNDFDGSGKPLPLTSLGV
jgi:hypothetical protein